MPATFFWDISCKLTYRTPLLTFAVNLLLLRRSLRRFESFCPTRTILSLVHMLKWTTHSFPDFFYNYTVLDIMLACRLICTVRHMIIKFCIDVMYHHFLLFFLSRSFIPFAPPPRPLQQTTGLTRFTYFFLILYHLTILYFLFLASLSCLLYFNW